MPVYEGMTIRGRSPNIRRPQQSEAPYVSRTTARLDDSPSRIAAAGSAAVNQANQDYWQNMGHFGAGLSALGRAGAEAYTHYSAAKAEELSTLHIQQLNQSVSGENGYLSRQGESSFSIAGEFGSEAQGLRDEAGKQLNPLAMRLYERKMRDFTSRESIKLQQYSMNQLRLFEDRNDDAAAENALNMAAQNYNDSEELNRWIGEALSSQGRKLDRQGFGEEAKAAAFKEIASGAKRGAFTMALANKDIDGARRVFNDALGKGGNTVRPHPPLPEGVTVITERIAKEEGVDPKLVQAVIWQESRGDPNAVSKAGARGFMQLMPVTAKEMGVTDVFDPEQNIRAGTQYLKKMLGTFNGDERLALMAYNWGPGNVKKWLAVGGDPAKIPNETLRYVDSLLGSMPSGENQLTTKDEVWMRNALVNAEKQRKGENAVAFTNLQNDFQNDALQGKDISGYRNFAKSEFIDAYGEERGGREYLKYTEAREANTHLRDMKDMTNEDIYHWTIDNRPGAGPGSKIKDSVYTLVANTMNQELAARAQDPAAYLISRDEDVARAREAMFNDINPDSVQAYAQVSAAAAGKRGMSLTHLFSQADILNMAATINASNAPMDELARVMESVSSYGLDVQRQLFSKQGGKMPAAAQHAYMIRNTGDGNRLWNASRDPEFVKNTKNVLGLTGSANTDFEDRLRSETEELAQTFGYHTDAAVSLQDSVRVLALLYMRDGKSAKDAVSDAAARFTDRYTVAGSLRIPKVDSQGKTIDAAAVMQGSRRSLNSVAGNPEDIEEHLLHTLYPVREGGSHEKQLQAMQHDLQDNGEWLVNEDESAARLFIHGILVRDKNGKPIEKTWDEFSSLAPYLTDHEAEARRTRTNQMIMFRGVEGAREALGEEFDESVALDYPRLFRRNR